MTDERVPQNLRELERTKSPASQCPCPRRWRPQRLQTRGLHSQGKQNLRSGAGDIGRGNSIHAVHLRPGGHAKPSRPGQPVCAADNYTATASTPPTGIMATQGIIGEYFEKGSALRFGTDALCYASSDFIWDSCLLHGCRSGTMAI